MDEKDTISYEYYLQDIERYREDFERTILEIYQLLNGETGVSDIEARIKSYRSFMKNLHYKDTHKTIKNLNDCFGIKMMLQDDASIKRALKKLKEEGYVIRKVKDHKNLVNTNYNAIHAIMELKGKTIPFEIQFRTPERSRGRLPHDLYKVVGPQKEITVGHKIEVLKDFAQLMGLLINGQTQAFNEELPISYEIRKDEKGVVKLIQIDDKEKIRKLYPTVREMLGKTVFDIILEKAFEDTDKKKMELSFFLAINEAFESLAGKSSSSQDPTDDGDIDY